jgi:molybdopterin molybdotransferase
MLPPTEAESLILNLVHPLDPHQDTETVHLLAAAGRILAAPVISQLDVPHWDNSAMDGYAVRSEDVQDCDATRPTVLQIVEEIAAGSQPQQTLQPGQAARIFTGAMMPAGADTVVIQEVTKREGDRVFVFTASPPQAYVRQRAAFYRAGDPLLSAGIRLTAPEIAVLAAAQCPQISVYRRPRVAIFSTGDELVSPDHPLQPGQIVDSNQFALATFVTQAGADPVLLGNVPDQPDALRQAIAHAVTVADIVLSSGGVSVGDYDFVDAVLESLQAQIHIRAVAARPGKPLTVATFAEPTPTLYFGLPGNPVSALVSSWRFVLPAVRKLSGLLSSWSLPVVKGRSLQDLRGDEKRETYLWGQLDLIEGEYEFRLAHGSHSSGNLINLANTSGLAVIPIGQTLIASGEPIYVMQLQ